MKSHFYELSKCCGGKEKIACGVSQTNSSPNLVTRTYCNSKSPRSDTLEQLFRFLLKQRFRIRIHTYVSMVRRSLWQLWFCLVNALTHYADSSVWNWQNQKFVVHKYLLVFDSPKRAKNSIPNFSAAVKTNHMRKDVKN